MKNLKGLFLVFAFFVSLSFISCKKNNSTAPSRLSVSLTDDPGSYDSVNIDIQDIRVNTGTDTGWTSLPLNKKEYITCWISKMALTHC